MAFTGGGGSRQSSRWSVIFFLVFYITNMNPPPLPQRNVKMFNSLGD